MLRCQPNNDLAVMFFPSDLSNPKDSPAYVDRKQNTIHDAQIEIPDPYAPSEIEDASGIEKKDVCRIKLQYGAKGP